MFDKFVEYVRNNMSSQKLNCYDTMESTGYAAMNCCAGKFIDLIEDKILMDDCVDCPFFVDVREKED